MDISECRSPPPDNEGATRRDTRLPCALCCHFTVSRSEGRGIDLVRAHARPRAAPTVGLRDVRVLVDVAYIRYHACARSALYCIFLSGKYHIFGSTIISESI